MRFFEAMMMLLVGFAILPGVVAILGALQDQVELIEGATTFELYLFALLPWLFFVGLLTSAVLKVAGKRKPPRTGGE